MQAASGGSGFGEWLFMNFDGFCGFLVSSSRVLACRWPPAGQTFEKRHLSFDPDGLREFLESPKWGTSVSCRRET